MTTKDDPLRKNFSESFQAVARDLGVKLYCRYSESESAAILKVSLATLKRIRARGEVAYLRVSPRTVQYFGYQLCSFLLSKVVEEENTVKQCTEYTNTVGSSVSAPQTPSVDKQRHVASAKRILGGA